MSPAERDNTHPQDTSDVFLEYVVAYLTELISLDPRSPMPKRHGMTSWTVYAKNAEDAILRLREQESVSEPIIEIASVQPTGRDIEHVVMPREWQIIRSLRDRTDARGGGRSGLIS